MYVISADGRVIRSATMSVRGLRWSTGQKGKMAERAQELLSGTGWLPEPLRTPGCPMFVAPVAAEPERNAPPRSASEGSAANGYETAVVDSERFTQNELVAAE